MNYLTQLNQAFKKIKDTKLSAKAQSLYFNLLHINNIRRWADKFNIKNNELMELTQLKENTLIKTRNELIEKEFIKYEKTKKNGIGKYEIIDFSEPTKKIESVKNTDMSVKITDQSVKNKDLVCKNYRPVCKIYSTEIRKAKGDIDFQLPLKHNIKTGDIYKKKTLPIKAREEKRKSFDFNNAINNYTENLYLRELLLEFVNYRKSKNKPLNKIELNKILKNLSEVGFNDEKKCNLLNACMAGGYLAPICDWKIAVRKGEIEEDFMKTVTKDKGEIWD